MKLEEGLEKFKDLPRDKYFEKNQELAKNLWANENCPTVYDIAQFVDGEENENINNIFNFFDNKEEFDNMVSRKGANYNEDESSSFIRKVIASNTREIAESGYFYKLLMASADNYLIKEDDCHGQGVEFNLEGLTEEDFNYRIKSMYVNELGNYVTCDFKQFKEIINSKLNDNDNDNGSSSIDNNDDESKNIPTIETVNEEGEKGIFIHVRTPMTCSHVHNRGVCRKCAGLLPSNRIENVGAFTTLMVTEHVTQSALSSMNKGMKQNINTILALRYDGPYQYEPIFEWMNQIVASLENDKVQARFYEMALLSRLHKDESGPFVSSLKGSIIHSGNIFGSYIFNPTNRNFEKMVKRKMFNDDSLKLKIAMNNYRKK